MSRVVLCVALLAMVSSASAQIIYTPVQYQYSAGGTTYYYGGNDPRVHELAAEIHSDSPAFGRTEGYAFVSGDAWVHREVSDEPMRVYTDALPRRNAGDFGFTPDDARNEAYANLPRYFVKRDLLNAAVRVDGSWIVPAHAEPIAIYKSNGTVINRSGTTMPPPLMIIPKDMLQHPPQSDKQVAQAN